VLVSALMFAASNFVLVDIRLGGFTLETRLAWAVLVPAALGFAGGCYRRRRARHGVLTGPEHGANRAKR
jgi:hypothetical protein